MIYFLTKGVNGYIFLDIIFSHSKSMTEFGFGLTHHSDIQKQTVASSLGVFRHSDLCFIGDLKLSSGPYRTKSCS